MKWTKFLQEHAIMEVGNRLPEHICTELIVDDPALLIALVVQHGYYISEIQWYERGKICTGTKLGMGGPSDPRAPEEYFFSEVVHISKGFPMTAEATDYLSYIDEIRSRYPDCDLHPSFDVAMRMDREEAK